MDQQQLMQLLQLAQAQQQVQHQLPQQHQLAQQRHLPQPLLSAALQLQQMQQQQIQQQQMQYMQQLMQQQQPLHQHIGQHQVPQSVVEPAAHMDKLQEEKVVHPIKTQCEESTAVPQKPDDSSSAVSTVTESAVVKKRKFDSEKPKPQNPFSFNLSDDSSDEDVFSKETNAKANSKESSKSADVIVVKESSSKASKPSSNSAASISEKGNKKGRGRPKDSKNKTAGKSALVKEIKYLRDMGALSVIKVDEPEESARNLRSNASKKRKASDSNDLEIECDPGKEFDPAMMDRMQACILKTDVTWDDVIGLSEVKQRLKEAAVLPILRPDLFVGPRASTKGVLLYGPPGTGKTMLARCAASAGNCTFFALTSSDIMSKWLGDAEKAVATLFHLARMKQPSIIFIDEVDSLMSARREGEHDSVRRIKTELLAQWDGVSGSDSKILVLGATNRPMDLDTAAMRRFGQHLYVPLPDIEARKKMFSRLAENTEVQVKLSEIDISLLGLETDNYSAADITNVIKDACMQPLREVTFDELVNITADELRPVDRLDIKKSLGTHPPTCSSDTIYQLELWKAAKE